jgi:F-type H+-transporting ATPase subunit delta
MPRPTTAARRYAEAAFELAGRDDNHEQWDEDLKLAAELVTDERISRIVDNPAVPVGDRDQILGRLLEKRVSRAVLNLVRLLAQRGRIDLLPAVSRQFSRLFDQLQGVVPATVTSASPLEPEQEEAVRARIEELTGRTVRLTSAVNADLIGGVMVQVGDQLIDSSVRGRLERLRDQLVAGSR